jgi:hypothetical protein
MVGVIPMRKLLIFCISLLAFLSAVTPIADDQTRKPPAPGYTESASLIQLANTACWEMLVRHNYETMEEREEEARR